MRQVVATELLSALAGRNVARRDRAREAFVKHDYLDEATRKLRTAQAPAERAAAARAIGYVKDTSTTAHLVAALEDDAPEVRRAAVESLAELRDPAAVEPLKSLLKRERDRKVPKNLIQRAIETCTTGPVEEIPAAATAVSGAELQELTLDAPPAAESNVFTIEDESQSLETEAASLGRQSAPAASSSIDSARDLLPGIITTGSPLFAGSVDTEAEAEILARRAAEEERKRSDELERQNLEALRKQVEAQRVAEDARQRAEEEARLAAEARLQAAKEQSRFEENARLRVEAEAEEARALIEKDRAVRFDAEVIAPGGPEASVVIASPELTPVTRSIEPLSDDTPDAWINVDIDEPQIVAESGELAEQSTGQSVGEPLQAEPFMLEADAPVPKTKEVEPAHLTDAREAGAQPFNKETEYQETERGIAEFDEFSSVPGAILKRLSSEEANERAAAVSDLVRVGGDDSFREINSAFDDPAVEVRNAAVRSLFNMNSDRAATFTRALRESPPERRRKIGAALASSGLASEAIGQLMGESREKTYDAFSLLFLMSKAGEVQPLMRAIEEHPNNEVRLAVVKLLALSGQQEILPAFRRLAVRGSLPTDVRSAVMEAIYQISSQSPTAA